MRPFATQFLGQLRGTLKIHRSFVVLLVLAFSFRMMAILVFRPGGYLGEMSDFGYYRLLLSFTSQGYYPLVDFWVEYPPIFPWLLLGLYRLSLLIPAWSQPGTWFYLLLSFCLALAETATFLMFYTIGRRLHGQDRATYLAWVYTLLLIPLLLLFVGFDSLALFFLLWAVLLTVDGHAIGAGVTAGLGFMTKLMPISAVPAALQHMNRPSQRAKLLAALLATVVVIAAPFLLAGPEYLIRSLESPVIRSTWETVWALVDGYYSYGVAGGVDRFDPAMAGAAQHPTQLPWPLITIGFGLLYLFLFTRRVDWADRRRVVAFTALTQNLLTLYFKGYSPQFLVMLLPFMILLIPGWRGIAYALLLSVINLVEYPIYFLLLPNQHWLLAGTVLLRTCILAITSAEYAAQVYGWRVADQRWRQIATIVVVLVGILALVGMVAGFRAYAQSRYDSSPHRPAMETLLHQANPKDTVVTDDQFLYEQLYPFLHTHFRVGLVETHDWLPDWQSRLAEVAAQSSGQLWVYAPVGSPLHAWLAERYPPLASHQFGEWQLSGWDTP